MFWFFPWGIWRNYRKFGQFFDERKKFYLRFLTGFWMHICRGICIQKYLPISILNGKLLWKVSFQSPFQRTFRPKEGVFYWFLLCEVFVLMFPKLLTVTTSLPRRKKEKGQRKKKVFKKKTMLKLKRFVISNSGENFFSGELISHFFLCFVAIYSNVW